MQMIIIIQKLYESIFLSPVTGVAVVFNEVYETLMDILTSSGVVKKKIIGGENKNEDGKQLTVSVSSCIVI